MPQEPVSTSNFLKTGASSMFIGTVIVGVLIFFANDILRKVESIAELKIQVIRLKAEYDKDIKSVERRLDFLESSFYMKNKDGESSGDSTFHSFASDDLRRASYDVDDKGVAAPPPKPTEPSDRQACASSGCLK